LARVGEVTASALSLPLRMCCKVVANELSMLMITVPESRSGTIWLDPL